MPETIANNLVAQWGAVGVLVLVLGAAVVVLWKRNQELGNLLVKYLYESAERESEHTAALVELNMFVRGSKR